MAALHIGAVAVVASATSEQLSSRRPVERADKCCLMHCDRLGCNREIDAVLRDSLACRCKQVPHDAAVATPHSLQWQAKAF